MLFVFRVYACLRARMYAANATALGRRHFAVFVALLEPVPHRLLIDLVHKA